MGARDFLFLTFTAFCCCLQCAHRSMFIFIIVVNFVDDQQMRLEIFAPRAKRRQYTTGELQLLQQL